MNYKTKAAAALSLLAIGVAPTLAIASPAAAPPGHGKGHTGKPVGSPGRGPTGHTGPVGTTGDTGSTGKTGKPYKIKHTRHAYGKLCQGESKVHVAGIPGTAFSKCVTALAHLDSGEASSPAEACKALSKKHVEGTNGTPFSRCVVAGAKLESGK
ncbi:MAG: hypothetical protein ACYDHH_07635 [Solirubrobacteraceae bacterium]